MKTLIYVNTLVAAAEPKPRKEKTLYGQTFTLPCTRAPGRTNLPLLPRSPNRVADVKRRVNGNVFRFRDVWSQTEADTLHFFPLERQQRRTDGAKEKKKKRPFALIWCHFFGFTPPENSAWNRSRPRGPTGRNTSSSFAVFSFPAPLKTQCPPPRPFPLIVR